MKIVSMSYSDFKRYSAGNGRFISYNLKYSAVLNFYMFKEHLDQNQTFLIEDVESTDSGDKVISKESLDTKETYARFGIYFKSLDLEQGMTISIDNPNRDYIVFIGKAPSKLDEGYIESYAKTFAGKYLPEGATPSWFIDLNEHKDYNSVRFVLNTLRNVYTKIESLVYYEDLMNNDVRDQSIAEDINVVVDSINKYYKKREVITKGKEVFKEVELVDITDVVAEIRKRVESSNDSTVDLFINKLDEIGNGVTPHKLYVYYGIYDEDYILAACYLTYFYGANCFIHSSLRERFLNQLMEMYYNPDMMLVEDRIKYLLNFPTYSLQLTDYTIGYIGTRARTVTGKIQLCPIQVDETMPFSNGTIDPKSVITVDNVDFGKIEIYPLLEHFKLDSSDLDECKIEETALRRLFIDFENAIILPREELVDVTNTFFINFKNEVCIAHLEDLRLETKSHIVADSMTSGTPEKPKVSGATNKVITISEQQVSRCIPLEVFHCADEGIRKITLANEYFYPVKAQQKLGLDPVIPLKVVKPYKCISKSMLPLANYSINKLSIPLKVDHERYFHDIGMYATACSAYRTGGRYKLLSTLDREEVRRKSTLFSAYGGFHEAISVPLTLTENMLVRRNIEK